MRRTLLIAVLGVLVVVAASATAAIAAAAAGDRGAASNRAAARRDAPALIAKLTLPPGATRVFTEPAGDNGYLKPLPELEADPANETAHAWWTVPGDPQSLIGQIKADPPAGSRLSGTGGAGNTRTGTSSLDVEYQSPAVAGVLGTRLLDVTVTSIGAGQTGVLAEAQSDWIVPRPSGERIPAATRVIQISSQVPGAADGGQATVTRHRQVQRIVHLINDLQIVQPGVTSCPELSDPRAITMTFSASVGGPVLALLSYQDYRPWRAASSDECEPVELTIGGRRRDPLYGGTLIERIQRRLGLRLS